MYVSGLQEVIILDQFSFFSDQFFWIPEVDCDCRMWKCPGCGCRVPGQPLNWYQFNYYKFCPYCGLRLYTYRRHVTDDDGLVGD